MNAQKSIKNIVSNILSQIIILALGIVIPRLVLVHLGSESNGLLSSVNQMLAYVALLEAGVGAASLQALYKPVAEQSKEEISEVLAATDHFYKRTGTLYFIAVLVLSLGFPYTIKTELSKSTVMWTVLLSGLPGVVNYYFQGKYRVLLRAEGKNYILTNLTTIIHVFTNTSKIILLLNGFNVVALQAMYLCFDVVQMVFIVGYIKRHYKWLDLKVRPNYSAISQSRNAMVHQISGFIFNNTDTMILTWFCGLSTVSVYSMYMMFYGMIATMITNFNGANFIFGQSFHTDRKRYMNLHDMFETYNMALTFSLFTITNIFILPFLKLYTESILDAQYIDEYLPYLFAATYLLSNGRTSATQVIEFAGHFKQTQWRAVIESVINIVVSLLGVYHFGIYGVLLGTIAALLYRTNDMIFYANKKILNRNPWITYRRWLLNLGLFIVVTFVAKWVFSFIALDSYITIILWAIVCCLVIIPFFFITVSLFEREAYRFAKELVMPYLKAAWGKLRRGKTAA